MIRRFFQLLFNFLGIIVTGGAYGSGVSTKSERYNKYREKRQQEFSKHGGRECKICGTRIPATYSYCGSCYHKYVKK